VASSNSLLVPASLRPTSSKHKHMARKANPTRVRRRLPALKEDILSPRIRDIHHRVLVLKYVVPEARRWRTEPGFRILPWL